MDDLNCTAEERQSSHCRHEGATMKTLILKRLWVVRPGKKSQPLTQELFLQKSVIALEEPGLGDLRTIKSDRQSFYAAYRRCDPDNTRTGIAGIGGKFFRFAHEMNPGDIVLCPSRTDNCVYVGCIKSPYRYAPVIDKAFPHQRSVQWRGRFPKAILSEWAQRELGAARTLFEITSHDEEIGNLIKTGKVEPLHHRQRA